MAQIAMKVAVALRVPQKLATDTHHSSHTCRVVLTSVYQKLQLSYRLPPRFTLKSAHRLPGCAQQLRFQPRGYILLTLLFDQCHPVARGLARGARATFPERCSMVTVHVTPRRACPACRL